MSLSSLCFERRLCSRLLTPHPHGPGLKRSEADIFMEQSSTVFPVKNEQPHSNGKSPCFSWENPLFLWPCSIATWLFTRGYSLWKMTPQKKKHENIPPRPPYLTESLWIFGDLVIMNYSLNQIPSHQCRQCAMFLLMPGTPTCYWTFKDLAPPYAFVSYRNIKQSPSITINHHSWKIPWNINMNQL